jgi:hypothetical protein
MCAAIYRTCLKYAIGSGLTEKIGLFDYESSPTFHLSIGWPPSPRTLTPRRFAARRFLVGCVDGVACRATPSTQPTRPMQHGSSRNYSEGWRRRLILSVCSEAHDSVELKGKRVCTICLFYVPLLNSYVIPNVSNRGSISVRSASQAGLQGACSP